MKTSVWITRTHIQLAMVAHTCNPTARWEWEQKNPRIQTEARGRQEMELSRVYLEVGAGERSRDLGELIEIFSLQGREMGRPSRKY